FLSSSAPSVMYTAWRGLMTWVVPLTIVIVLFNMIGEIQRGIRRMGSVSLKWKANDRLYFVKKRRQNDMIGKQWIDISQPLTNKIAVWPGDTPYSFHLALTKEETSSVNIGKLTMGVHTGTHIDAPFHFNQRGQKVDELDLDVYMGRARLLDMTGHDIIGKQEFINEDLDGVKRLLVRTRNEIDPEMFPHSFTVFDPNVGPFLKEKGV